MTNPFYFLKLLSWGCCLLALAEFASALKSPVVTLSDGNEIPVAGFGTHFRTPTEEENALLSALEVGYRHFDTAYLYGNEKTIGKALKKWFTKGGKREELFITTKLPPQGMRREDVETYLKKSLENLGLDYVDAYLIHLPVGFMPSDKEGMSMFEKGAFEVDPTTDHIAIWRGMEEQVKAGRVKSIGLSNFNESQILNIYDNAEIKPTLVQVELNLYLQQRELRKLCKDLNIRVTAYSPLGSNDLTHLRRRRSTDDEKTLPPPMKHPVVREIAEKHGKSPAQVLLRYSIQNDVVVIPKSGNPKRQRENLDVFDFSLTSDDVARLASLDQHGKVRKFDLLTLDGVSKHPEYPFAYKIQ